MISFWTYLSALSSMLWQQSYSVGCLRSGIQCDHMPWFQRRRRNHEGVRESNLRHNRTGYTIKENYMESLSWRTILDITDTQYTVIKLLCAARAASTHDKEAYPIANCQSPHYSSSYSEYNITCNQDFRLVFVEYLQRIQQYCFNGSMLQCLILNRPVVCAHEGWTESLSANILVCKDVTTYAKIRDKLLVSIRFECP